VRRDSPVQVEFSGSTLARLTPADPTSGEFVWYSNRGDATEFTLTRSFDLNSIDSATLNYNAWYQLEDFYDYAYLEVSTDGGDTWEILETAHGTDNDPNLASQGFGYTGSSVEWLSESIDLSPYAGQEIMLRFHVITGLSTNREGFQVDDIAIPELGYFDGAEDDNGGWQAKGFVRSSNLVPVEWILWLVKTTNPLEVERITLNPDQSAEFTIEGLGEEFPLAAVAISPTAPVSTANLDYEITFRQP
jgi:bacillopeptidase F (M6 metalloprotease family)